MNKRLSPPNRIILLQQCWTIVLHNKARSVATTVQVCSTPAGAQRCTMHLRRTNPAALVVGGWANYLELALTQNGTIHVTVTRDKRIAHGMYSDHYTTDDCTKLHCT